MEVIRLSRTGSDIKITHNGRLMLSAFRGESSIYYKYDDIRISHTTSELGCYLLLKVPVGGVIYSMYILYNSATINDKFRAIHEFITKVESTVITHDSKIYHDILDTRRFLAHKLECIFSVISKEEIVKRLRDGDDIRDLITDVINS